MNIRSLFAQLVLGVALTCHTPLFAQAPAPGATTPSGTAAAVPSITPVPVAGSTAAPAAHSAANPYGLSALWAGSDVVARSVLVLLMVMSLGSWYVMVVKLIEQARMRRQAKAAPKAFDAASVAKGAELLEQGSPFRFVANAGVQATSVHTRIDGHVEFGDWVMLSIQRAVERVQARMQNGLSVLATVGSIAPFVGLFGTVWGIYHALTAIGAAGQASIDKVAGPVGEALIMTAIGLAVAVPAVLGYNWLVRRNKGVLDDVRDFGDEMHSFILASTPRA